MRTIIRKLRASRPARRALPKPAAHGRGDPSPSTAERVAWLRWLADRFPSDVLDRDRPPVSLREWRRMTR